jgi:PAS domain S-box-containing protein
MSLTERFEGLLAKNPALSGLVAGGVSASFFINDFFYEIYSKCGETSQDFVEHFGFPLVAGSVFYLLGKRRKEINELAGAQMELIKSKADLETVLNTANEGIMRLDENNHFLGGNKKIYEMLGYTSDELRGKDKTFWTDPACLSLMESELAKREKGVQSVYEANFVKKDGTKFTGLVAGSPIFENGKYAGVIGCIMDVSSYRANEEEKKLLKEQLQQGQKMQTLGAVAGGIAHDFNNHLTVIMGNLGLIQHALRSKTEGANISNFVENSLIAAERARVLTTDLTDFARTEKYTCEPVKIDDFIRDYSVESSSFICEKNPEYKLVLNCQSSREVYLDSSEMNRVLMNFISNAVDAMASRGLKEGEIVVGTKDYEFRKPFDTGYEKIAAGAYTSFYVSDSGTGVKPEDLDRLKKCPLFVSTKGKNGTGFGVANSLRILKGHDAYLGIETEVGKGSTFSAYFLTRK